MKNPKQFIATPYNHDGKIDMSGPDSMPTENGKREWMGATSFQHKKPVRKSGNGENIGNPYPVSSDRVEKMTAHNHFEPTPHSNPMAPKDAKKWHKSAKYDMTLPTTMSEGSRIAKKMKAT